MRQPTGVEYRPHEFGAVEAAARGQLPFCSIAAFLFSRPFLQRAGTGEIAPRGRLLLGLRKKRSKTLRCAVFSTYGTAFLIASINWRAPTDRANCAPVLPRLQSRSERALRVGERLLACVLVAGTVSCTRTRHGLRDSVNRLRRYFAKSFLDGSHRAWCRLITHACEGARRSNRTGGGFRFELGVDAALHAGNVIRAWAGTRRYRHHRGSEQGK